jgi:hypothetical protein
MCIYERCDMAGTCAVSSISFVVTDDATVDGGTLVAETRTANLEATSEEKSSSTGVIIGASIGVLLAVAGTAFFVGKKNRRNLDEDEHSLMIKEFSKTASGDSEESAQLNATSREIQFGGRSKNLSVAAFLTGEAAPPAGAPSSKGKKRAFFGGGQEKGGSPSPEMVPISPAHSLFSTGSRKNYSPPNDVVDL